MWLRIRREIDYIRNDFRGVNDTAETISAMSMTLLKLM
jgi:hypothetical protein